MDILEARGISKEKLKTSAKQVRRWPQGLLRASCSSHFSQGEPLFFPPFLLVIRRSNPLSFRYRRASPATRHRIRTTATYAKPSIDEVSKAGCWRCPDPSVSAQQSTSSLHEAPWIRSPDSGGSGKWATNSNRLLGGGMTMSIHCSTSTDRSHASSCW